MFNGTDDESASHRYVRCDGLNVSSGQIYFRVVIVRSADRIQEPLLYWQSQPYVQRFICCFIRAKTFGINLHSHTQGGGMELYQQLIPPHP